MVDTETYKLMHSSDDEQISHSEISEETLKAANPPEGSFALMLPPTIRGFGFHNKKWSTPSYSLDTTKADRTCRST
jgi:hypothetical protein